MKTWQQAHRRELLTYKLAKELGRLAGVDEKLLDELKPRGPFPPWLKQVLMLYNITVHTPK